MFKALRDRLKGVSKQLEDELETQLADQLEAELAAEMEAESASAATGEALASPAVAPSPPAPSPAAAPASPGQAAAGAGRVEPPAGPHPAHEHTRQEPVSDSQVPDHPDDGGAAATPSVQASTPTAQAPATAPATSTPPAPAKAVPEDGPSVPGKSDAPAVPSAPAAERRPDQPSAPAPSAPATQAPAATAQPSPQQARTPQPQQKFGRKILSDEEIERRLQAELESAVEVQKEVETTVGSGGVVTRFTINEDVLEDILWELELALLESDVAVPVIEAIKKSVKEQLLSLPVAKAKPEDIVEKVLRTAIKRVLNVSPVGFDAWLQEKLKAKKPVVIMFVGVNGTGKTTSIGRLAYRLQQQGISSVMAAGDTFRAGAIEQLALHGERLGIKVVKHTAGADPAAVAYDAIEHAKARHKDVVLLDTAGRMQNNTNLMDEMDKIRRVADPDLCIFVGDSLAGNDAVEQARRFDEVVDIGGAILTKVDVDAKGGAALSVAYTINKPLLFVGVGQEYPDLRPFDAAWMVDRLFGDEEQPVAA